MLKEGNFYSPVCLEYSEIPTWYQSYYRLFEGVKEAEGRIFVAAVFSSSVKAQLKFKVFLKTEFVLLFAEQLVYFKYIVKCFEA